MATEPIDPMGEWSEEAYAPDCTPEELEAMHAKFTEGPRLKAAIRWARESYVIGTDDVSFMEYQADKGNEHAKVLLKVLEDD